MKQHAISGIVLHSKDMFEKDKIIELFTIEKGKIKCLAKYANTSSFKFGGKLEPGNIIHCQLYKGRSFDILMQCDLAKNFPGIRSSYNKITLLMYVFDTIRLATNFEQENAPLYELIDSILHVLDQKEINIEDLQHDFENNFLKTEGLLAHQSESGTHLQFKNIFYDYTGKDCRSPQYLAIKS